MNKNVIFVIVSVILTTSIFSIITLSDSNVNPIICNRSLDLCPIRYIRICPCPKNRCMVLDYSINSLCYIDCRDLDKDGIGDCNDMCLNTLPDSPERELGTNRWIWSGEDWITNSPRGKDSQKDFTMEQTHGCSCSQILGWLHANYPEQYGDMKGQYKFGCSVSIMEDFIRLIG